MKPPQPKTLPIIYRLPQKYSLEIGKITARWAYVEWWLRQIAYLALNVTPPVGRIAVRELREPEYLDMITDILDLRGIKPTGELSELRVDLEKWGRWRNRFVHGVWVKHPESGELMVQATTGQWDKGKLAPGEKLSRKVLTEAIPVTVEFLREIVSEIGRILASLKSLWYALDAYLSRTSPDKSQPQSPSPDRRMDHIARKLPPRQKSSRA